MVSKKWSGLIQLTANISIFGSIELETSSKSFPNFDKMTILSVTQSLNMSLNLSGAQKLCLNTFKSQDNILPSDELGCFCLFFVSSIC